MSADAERERSHWGWGWADREPDRASLEALAFNAGWSGISEARRRRRDDDLAA